MPNVRDLIRYLSQLDPETEVVRTERDVTEPMQFLALENIPLEHLDD